MSIFNQIKEKDRDAKLSETQFYTVKEVTSDSIITVNEFGETATLSRQYVDTFLNSSDHFEEVVRCNKTELEQLFKGCPLIVMTVVYRKQVKEKDVIEALIAQYPNKGGVIKSREQYTKDIKDTVKTAIKGELRTARGYHTLSYGSGGRLYFVDMDKPNNPEKDYDTRIIQVDPRTIESIIVKSTKYELK